MQSKLLENTKDENENSLVAIATMQGDYKMLQILSDQGMNLNSQNKDGNTALHFAIRANFVNCIDLLLRNGADESIENNLGLTAWEIIKNKRILCME